MVVEHGIVKALALVVLFLVPPSGLVELPPLAEIPIAVTAEAPAERLDPPPTTEAPATPTPTFSGASSNGRCVGAEDLLADYSPGWDVGRMSRICYRESRGDPSVTSRTGCCHGLFQIHQMHIPKLHGCGVYSVRDLFDPIKNICSAAVLWRAARYSPWAT